MSEAEGLALYYCVKWLHRLPSEIDLTARVLVDLGVVQSIQNDIDAAKGGL